MNAFQDYFVHEFVEEYRAGRMSRRDMMRRVLYITGGVASTATLLTVLGCAPATRPTPSAAPFSAPALTTAPTAAPPTTGTSTSPAPASAAATTGPSSAATPPSSAPAVASPAASIIPVAGTRSPLSVPENDPGVQAQMVSFPNSSATIQAYLARPAAAPAEHLPEVLVCHENQGLTAHIKDVSRRFAKAGYAACAVDLLSRQGGTASVTNTAQIPALLSRTDPSQEVSDFQAAATYLQQQPWAAGDRIGMNGFCFGGGITWLAVEEMPELKAAVPFYGPPPPLDQVGAIKAALLGVYSSDTRDFANNNRDQLDAALTAAGVTHQFNVYPGTSHAFNNDTGAAYNQQQALAAWQDTLAWFGKYL